MRFNSAFVLTLGLCLCGSAKGNEVSMIGSGGSSCGTWLDHRKNNHAVDVEQWVVGFASGVAWSGYGDPLRGVDFNGVLYWVDKYCREHTLDTISDAAIAFLKQRHGD